LDKKKAKIKQLSKAIEDSKAKEVKSIEEYELLKKKIEDNQKEASISSKKITELTQEINDAKEKISKYEKELKEAHESIKKLEDELKEVKSKWEESIHSREAIVKEVSNQNDGDIDKLEKENKKLLENLTLERQALKECQNREQVLLNEVKSFEEKLKKINIELNEKCILSTDLAEQIDRLQKEQENSQKKIKESENKLIAIQEQLDATIRERDEKLIQYNKLERQLEDNKHLLDQYKNGTSEEKDKELALAAEQIEVLMKTNSIQEKDLGRIEKLEKEKLIYESNIKELKSELERIQNDHPIQSTRNVSETKEMGKQINQLKASLESLNSELAQKNTELEIIKKASKYNEESNRKLQDKIKDYESKVEEIKDLKEKMKDYNEKAEELERLRNQLKDYDETIEELKKLKDSIKDYNEKVEELNKLKDSINDYNEKVEELNKLRESVKDYDEKIEELNKLKESVKDYDEKVEELNKLKSMTREYNQKIEEFNKMEASVTKKSRSVTIDDDNEENKGDTVRDKEIDELKAKCAELEITTMEDQLKIKELEDSLNYQQTEFESLESSWDDLKSYVSELEKEIEISHASLNEKKAKLIALEKQVDILKKELESSLVNKGSDKIDKASGIKVILSEKEMCNLQHYFEKAKVHNNSKNNKDISELILSTLSTQEKEIDNLKLKLDQNILKFNSQNKRGSRSSFSDNENEKEKLKKITEDAECLREQNLQLAKELAETKSQYKAREIEVEKVTDSLFSQISNLENEFLTLEENKNSILYDFKQYKYTVNQEMKQLVEKHSTPEERKQLELETKQREKNQKLNSDKEDEMVCDTYKVYIDKLDESLTKKDKEIIDFNIIMNENKKEIDRFKNQLIELEKAHEELLQGDNNSREITSHSDPSLLKEKVAHIKNLELSLGDAMDKIKSYETNQSSLMEQNKKLNKELEEAKEEARKLSIEVEDAKRKRSEIVKAIGKGEAEEVKKDRKGSTLDVNKESELSQEILVYQQKLKAANEEIQELLTTINEQKEMIESMNNELNQLRSNLERINSENYNNQEILNNQIINLSQKLNSAKIENQNQKRTISELEQAAARISASNINAAAEEQFPMENQTIQQLKNKVEFLQNRIEALQNEKKSEEEASKNNIETAKARIAAMESLMIAYRNKIAESNKKALAAESQIQEQNQEIDRLYNEIGIAHSQLQSIERQVGRAMPSGVARRQGTGENSQEPLNGQNTIFTDETLNSQTKPSHPLNEETLIGKSRTFYDKTIVNPELTEENKNFDNSVDIMSSDTNVMIMKNNQLETDPLIRDCMNIFSTLDNMSLNFTPDFMIEKDADLENSVLNGSIIIDHPSYDNKYGVVSSSKDHEEINFEEENVKNVNENKENEKEEGKFIIMIIILFLIFIFIFFFFHFLVQEKLFIYLII